METRIDPATTTLLVVDPQIDMLNAKGALWDLVGGEVQRLDVVGKLAALKAAAEEVGIVVMYATVGIDEPTYAGLQPVNGLQALMSDRHVAVPGKGGECDARLVPGASTVMLRSRTGPSPATSDLQSQLEARGIKTLIVAGMIANLCVESHVREVSDWGYRTLVVGDALGSTGGPETHSATLANMSLFATEVAECHDVLQALKGLLETA